MGFEDLIPIELLEWDYPNQRLAAVYDYPTWYRPRQGFLCSQSGYIPLRWTCDSGLYRFSPNEDSSGIALCAESRFISESNTHTFFVCGVFGSTTNGFSSVSDMLRGRTHNDMSPFEHTTPRRTVLSARRVYNLPRNSYSRCSSKIMRKLRSCCLSMPVSWFT